MNIWKVSGNRLFQSLLETIAVEEKRVEQIQCPHDLGGCGRFIDRSSGTYIDRQTKRRVRDLEKTGRAAGLGIFIAGLIALIVSSLSAAAFQEILDTLKILSHSPSRTILDNHNFIELWVVVFSLICLISLIGKHFIEKRVEKLRSQADRIESYHCPNPACGLRSTFINGKPVKSK